MIDDLYSDKILFYAGNIPYTQRLFNPQYHATKYNKLCGARVEVAFNMADAKIISFSQTLETCALGQASASILAHHIIGKTMQEIMSVFDMVFDMLKKNGYTSQSQWKKCQWKDFYVLKCAQDFPARHASILLIFETIKQAYESGEHTG